MASIDTTSVAVARAVVAGVAVMGGDVGRLLEAVGVPWDQLGDPDARVSIHTVIALFREAERITGSPAFGLRAGQAVPEGALEVLDYATRSSRTIGEGLERMVRYFALIVEGTETKFETIGDLARITHSSGAGLRVQRHAVEMLFAVIIARGRTLTGKEWPLLGIGFAHPKPADTQEHERFFRAPIRFEQPTNEILFERGWLDEPLVTANPNLAPMLDRFAEDLVTKLPSADSFLLDVRRAIAGALVGHAPSLEATAKELAMSTRTLQRKLQSLETSHQAIVESVRRDLAGRYLADRRINLREVAYLLGFSEPSVFHRAFRRWTEQTPAEYRALLLKKDAK